MKIEKKKMLKHKNNLDKISLVKLKFYFYIFKNNTILLRTHSNK